MVVFELRAITSEEFENVLTFYRDGLGLDPGDMWTNDDRGQLFHTGHGNIEILDTEHSEHVDQIEFGERV